MAGDWIKFRAELLTHPKFLALHDAVAVGKGNGLLWYAMENDYLTPGLPTPKDYSVYSEALRAVTADALRAVTMVRLLTVWDAVNRHCRVADDDAIVEWALFHLDDISGIDGFGEALADTGWVVEDESSNCLIFPNFLQWNEPACLRQPPLTNAERQARHRQRERLRNANVTESNGSNAREEKSPLDWTRLDRDRCADLPEKEIRRIVQHISKTVPIGERTYRADVKRLAQAAMLQLMGVFSEDDIEAMLERIRKRKIKRPGAYFTGCLKKQLAAVGYDWKTMFDALNPPQEILNGKPE